MSPEEEREATMECLRRAFRSLEEKALRECPEGCLAATWPFDPDEEMGGEEAEGISGPGGSGG